jgi:hypothetical protein
MLLVNSSVQVEAQDRLPDLEQALRGGKLIHKVDPKLMVGFRYEYGADLNFEELKKKIMEFLGENWKEKEADPRVSKALKQVMKTEGIDLVGYVTFANPVFPEDEVTLSVKREKSDEKVWYIVDLSGTWNKTAEQE